MNRRKISRRVFLAGSASAVGAVALGASFSPPRRFRKFVLVTVDTLRADHLGCYGYSQNTSPNIDAFADGSIRFERAFSAAPFTSPSIAAILTSRFAGTGEQLLANGRDMKAISGPTLSSVLYADGFATGAFVGNFVLRPSTGLTTGFADYIADFDSKEANRDYVERVASSLTPDALRWLKAYAEKPFFLWLHYQDPHGPYAPPARYRNIFAPGDNSESLPILKDNKGFEGIPAYQALDDHTTVGYYISQYDGEIRFLDDWLGKLFATLDELGISDETVVILTADHGEALGENGYWFCHGHFVTPELTRVPLVLHVPGGKAASEAAPVSLIDIAPTVLELAGVENPEEFTGVSLFETIGKKARTGVIFTETETALAAVEKNYMFVWGKPKNETGLPENPKALDPARIGFDEAPMHLYDISKDLSCSSDAGADSSRWLRYLRGVSQEYLRICAENHKAGEPLEMSDEAKKILRSLGYLSD